MDLLDGKLLKTGRVINILLSFVLAWVVYNVVEEIQEGAEVENSALPASLAN